MRILNSDRKLQNFILTYFIRKEWIRDKFNWTIGVAVDQYYFYIELIKFTNLILIQTMKYKICLNYQIFKNVDVKATGNLNRTSNK